MSFDSRIKNIDEAIQHLNEVEDLNLSCPRPLSTSEWNNSQAREALEELFQSLDEDLEDFKTNYEDLIGSLEDLKKEIEKMKRSSLQHHQLSLFPLSEVNRIEYLRTTKMDPSVRRLL